MPSPMKLEFLRNTVRNHPVIVSTTAATGGILLGAFVAVQLLGAPKPLDNVGSVQTAVETKVAPNAVAESKPATKPVAETTGSAPTGESVASADCEQQTWPHLSRVCMEEFRAKNRNTRVVTTDKLDKPTIAAIETQPVPVPAPALAPAPSTSLAPSTPPAPSTSPSAPRALPPGAVAVTPPPAVAELPKPAPVSPPVVTSATGPASAPVPAVAPAATTPPVVSKPPRVRAAEVSPQPTARSEAQERRAAKKAQRKYKGQPTNQDVDDDGGTFASADPDEQAFEDRGYRSRGDRRSRREIVERWTERDYDVPDSRGGRRQVTVIRRNNGGGLFESMFGN